MSDGRQQLLTLVKEARLWLEQKWEEGCRFTRVAPIKLKKPAAKPSPQPKQTATQTPRIKWVLDPMPLPSITDSLCNLFEASFTEGRLVQPQIPIVLILPEDKPLCRLFFENVARAITYTIAPARVMVAESLPTNSSVRLIVAPLTLLQKSHPNLHIHCLYQTEGPTLLPLEEIECYLENLSLKRTLWNILKTWHFPNTLQSSAT